MSNTLRDMNKIEPPKQCNSERFNNLKIAFKTITHSVWKEVRALWHCKHYNLLK